LSRARIDTFFPRNLECTRVEDVMSLQVVSFAQISQILEVTDALGLNREWVEIPLSPESP